jgi:hypothetical protein
MTHVATPGYGGRMSPNSPRTPARQFRIGDEWYDFDAAAKSVGTERATVLRDLIRWYIGEPGAELPPLPSRDVVLSARARRQKEAK